MFKNRIRLIAVALIVLFAFSCFAGCKKGKDVYGAASEFVKTSSEEKQETETSRDNDNGGSGKQSSDAAVPGNDNSSGTENSSAAQSSDKENSEKTDSSDGLKDNSSSVVSSNEEPSADVTVETKPNGDYGPIVHF